MPDGVGHWICPVEGMAPVGFKATHPLVSLDRRCSFVLVIVSAYADVLANDDAFVMDAYVHTQALLPCGLHVVAGVGTLGSAGKFEVQCSAAHLAVEILPTL